MYKLFFLMFLFSLNITPSTGQQLPINKKLIGGSWTASWINCPEPAGAGPRDYGVYHFRKIVDLAGVPAKFIVHVSGDNRYRLFVNGKAVCSGPARGDLANWNFETVDLAPFQSDCICTSRRWGRRKYRKYEQELESGKKWFLSTLFNR